MCDNKRSSRFPFYKRYNKNPSRLTYIHSTNIGPKFFLIFFLYNFFLLIQVIDAKNYAV